jgi:hypothetical protein
MPEQAGKVTPEIDAARRLELGRTHICSVLLGIVRWRVVLLFSHVGNAGSTPVGVTKEMPHLRLFRLGCRASRMRDRVPKRGTIN